MALSRRRAEPKIEMDDTGVRKHVAGQDRDIIRWDELVSLEIRATVHPSGLQPVWVMSDRSGEQLAVAFPEEPEGFLARVQMLPGFDYNQFMASMRATSDATFTCWRRSMA